MGPLELVLVLLLIVAPAVIGYRSGLKRRHEVLGLLLGLFVSWIGVLIVVLLPKATEVPS
jgi:hypothetical protein